jgi:hypothetical protein
MDQELRQYIDAKFTAVQKDLEKFAKTFATKQDLEKFATKEDLEKFATKQDLEKFATKQDLERVETALLTEFHKWASPLDARMRTHTAALRAIDAEMEALTDRVQKLEGN